jgi:hypothetical protein
MNRSGGAGYCMQGYSPEIRNVSDKLFQHMPEQKNDQKIMNSF